MTRRTKTILAVATVALALAGTAYGVVRMRRIPSLTGVVLREDPSPENQLDVPGAEVRITNDITEGVATTDSAGYFHVKLQGVQKGEDITIHVRHPNYQPDDVLAVASDRLYVIRMKPAAVAPRSSGAPVVISDVRLRYGLKSQMTENIGSVVKMFEVRNTGDVPCEDKPPCSPDKKWKAAIWGASVDAGDDNQFQDARVFCIAGPCPFTKIEKDSFSQGGGHIGVLVRNWSDTATFVIQAEVMHTMSSDTILHSYPVIFNQTASFALPARAQGPSIEATVDRQEIVYPLGPAAKLSWADCDVQSRKDSTRLYQCVLKPGYQFQPGNESH
jgi:hypothetical protein